VKTVTSSYCNFNHIISSWFNLSMQRRICCDSRRKEIDNRGHPVCLSFLIFLSLPLTLPLPLNLSLYLLVSLIYAPSLVHSFPFLGSTAENVDIDFIKALAKVMQVFHVAGHLPIYYPLLFCCDSEAIYVSAILSLVMPSFPSLFDRFLRIITRRGCTGC
jgi:hypothetical protein